MNRIFMSILAVGTAVVLSAGPVFAGGEVLSDGDLDSITAASHNGSDDTLVGGSGGGVQNNDKSQQYLMAVNNVNASQSNVANQTNMVATKYDHSLISYIRQSNKARFNADNGLNSTYSTRVKDPKNNDDLLVAGSGGGVQNNNKSQQFLTALNNVNASQSNVANQTNIAIAGSFFGHLSIVKQSNKASFYGSNGGNSAISIRD